MGDHMNMPGIRPKNIGIGGPTRKSRGGSRGGHKENKERAQAKVLDFLALGDTVATAMEKVGRSMSTWENWRSTDEDFKAKADIIRATKSKTPDTREGRRNAAMEMGFQEFRKKYLHSDSFRHQLQWIDLLEGREPRDLHENQVYEPGEPGLILINTAPNHGKTQTISIDYVTYRICIDPSVLITIISKKQEMAAQMLGAVKMRLTHPRYADLIKDFAPEGGFQASALEWTKTHVTLATEDRDGVEKDPTIQAVGMGGQIYGARGDLFIVDDAVLLENANEWEHQMAWITQEVGTRPGASGTILVVGTRVSPNDLYYQLRNDANYDGFDPPWTYLTQPAILENQHATPDQWVTLWPTATMSWTSGMKKCWCKTDECTNGYEDGSFPRWDGKHLVKMRQRLVSEQRFALVYMQQDVGGDAIFPAHAIANATNKGRRRGKAGGMVSIPEGCRIIGGVDPAVSGHAGFVVLAIHPVTKVRYVVDVLNMKGPRPDELKAVLKTWTQEYGVHEWRIEKDGLNAYFTQDTELLSWMNARGTRFTPHMTRGKKFNPEWGVASMALLFGQWETTEDGERKALAPPLIDLPRCDTDDLRALVHQLSIWTPELDPKRTPCDLVMALWFAELGARDVSKQAQQFSGGFRANRPFLSPREKAKCKVIDLSAWQAS